MSDQAYLLISAIAAPAVVSQRPSQPKVVPTIRCITDYTKVVNDNAYFTSDSELSIPFGTTPINVTGQVGGFYIDVLTTAANGAGIPIEFYVQNENPASTSAMLASFGASRGDYDCVFSGTHVKESRLDDVDYLVPLTQFGLVVTTQVVEVEATIWDGLFQFLAPFANEVWFCIVALFLISGALVIVFEGTALGNTFKERAQRAMYQSFGTFTGVAYIEPTTGTAAVFSILLSFTVLLLVSAYTANLAAHLTVSAVAEAQVTSIDSFSEQGKTACALGSNYDWMQENYPNVLLHEVDQSVDQTQAGEVRKGTCAGFVYADILSRSEIVSEEACDFEIVGSQLTLGYYGVPWQKNSTNPSQSELFKDEMNKQIASMIETGEMLTFIQRYFPLDPATAAGCGTSEIYETSELGLRDLAGTFLITVFAAPILLGVKCLRRRGLPSLHFTSSHHTVQELQSHVTHVLAAFAAARREEGGPAAPSAKNDVMQVLQEVLQECQMTRGQLEELQAEVLRLRSSLDARPNADPVTSV
jgi:hypothetical protein